MLESLRSAFSHLLEGADDVQTLLQVRGDRTRLSIRKSVTLILAGLLAATAIVPLILGGVVLFVLGVAQSLAQLFGDRLWLGNLIGGALILGLIAATAWFVNERIARNELAKKVAKYEEIRRRHAERFGARTNGTSAAPTGPVSAGIHS